MQTKEYIVSLKKGVSYNQLWSEIENPTLGLPHIPDRAVSIVENHDAFDRLCAYSLTDAEAEQLKKDPRVNDVEIPVEQMPGIEIKPITTQKYNNFTKPTTSSAFGTNINWGLIRNSNPTNVYGTSTSANLSYNYVLDGTGVDVVISDSGIQANHPEFTDENGVSRVQQINWATYVPALSTMPSPYQDPDGHGTHVAGIVAGKTHGWAKGARIYSILATGAGQPSPVNQFAAIKLWHQSKGANGRPTVVNMSWGTFYPWWSLAGLPSDTPVTRDSLQLATFLILLNTLGVNYRGTFYPGFSSVTNFGVLLDPYNINCLISLANGIPYRNTATDTALEELIDAGVIVVRAAGNNSYKIDKPVSIGGSGDYNNYVSHTLGAVYYHRGSSPAELDDDQHRSIRVGNLDSVVYNAIQDQKSTDSSTGPGVDVYAAGTNIVSSTTSDVYATTYSLSSPYFLNSSFRQLNISGTSMASPQIAGMAALYLQARPLNNNLSSTNSAQVKSWITSSATNTMYSSGSTTDYINFRSTVGGIPAAAYQPIQGLTKVKDATGTWKTVTDIKVKTAANTWSNVKAVWTKTTSGWRQTY